MGRFDGAALVGTRVDDGVAVEGEIDVGSWVGLYDGSPVDGLSEGDIVVGAREEGNSVGLRDGD